MPEPSQGIPEPFRAAEADLNDLVSCLAKTIAEVREHGVILDRLRTDGTPTDQSHQTGGEQPATPNQQAVTSVFILALEGAEYDAELAALRTWVHHLLLPVYGREISSTRPWCAQWEKHPEAVARLHGLWLAWQQLTNIEAGLSGPSTWHRDHLDQAMAQLRSPDGPFAACTTSSTRPNHRLLPTPAPKQLGLTA